ncbi:hypothetical protein J6Z48_00960 [bacterium]|nr:hypothetical protein [bacterium]
MDEDNKKKKIPRRKSVHVVFYSCPHCSHEMDDIKFCPVCDEPMRVIDVVDKFGEDAEKFIARAQKRLSQKKPVISDYADDDDYVGVDKEEPNIILMGDEKDNLDDGGIDPSIDDDGGLDVIFPDDTPYTPAESMDTDDDLSKALEQLDTEEDEDITAEDFGFEDGDIPEL